MALLAGSARRHVLLSIAVFGGMAAAPILVPLLVLGYYTVEINKNDGGILATTASIKWRPHPNLGLGAGYTYFDVDLGVTDVDSKSSFNVSLSGPILYLTGGF